MSAAVRDLWEGTMVSIPHNTAAFSPAASYPATYRQQDVRIIVDAIKARQSILISGLAGSGKSHLVRFLASNLGFRAHYFGQDAADLSFFLLDCNAMNAQDERSFYQVLLTELCPPGRLGTGYRLQDMTHAELLLAIRECLNRLYHARLTLVLLVDRLDKYRESEQLRPILDNLRFLRDAFARRISYVLATRGELDIASISNEFADLLYDPATLYLKPMTEPDATFVIDHFEQERGATFDAPQRASLIDYSGAYPRLLRQACLLAHEGRLDLGADRDDAIRQLLADQRIKDTCLNIWNELSNAAQSALWLVAARTATSEDSSLLIRYGLVTVDQSGRFRVFCPLFEALVQEKADPRPRLKLVPPYRVQRGTELIQLTRREYRFLAYLFETPNQVRTFDDIIYAVWGAYDGANNQDVSKLASLVGAKINIPGHVFIENVRGVGYRLNLGHGTKEKQI